MLYSRNEQPFSESLYANPTSEYRGTPFWAWNCKLDEGELLRQIDILKEMGYGGFHMHVRTGMATDYLSDEYMALVKSCVEKARSGNMLAWLYDEDRWPSGAAGGFVTRDKANRMHYLLLTQEPYGQGGGAFLSSSATAVRTENGELIACYDVQLDAAGSLAQYRRIDADAEAQGIKLYAYMETAESSPWFNNQAYADTLSPRVMAEFIKVTYDRYEQYFAGDFGGIVPAIFTDEPQFSHKTTLNFASEAKDVTIPWTPDIDATYRQMYGNDILDTIPELLWELPKGASRARYQYHDHICERFTQAFADQCGDWCKRHNLMLTGHMMEEPTLHSQTAALGEAMRSYRGFQLPGIDMLCNRFEFNTAKQAQSAARQFGYPGVLSELYGVTNWDFDFRGHKIQGDWQAALGVTVRVPHLSWVSMNGEAKRDYPGTFNYQAPWYREYPLIEDHYARLNTALTRGRAVARIGVIHPVESYWLHWGAAENTRAVREQLDSRFENLTDWLLRGLIDFDFISESLLVEQCAVDQVSEDAFPVGQMAYEAVIVPGCETLRSTTLSRLEAFCDAGGHILFLGEPPVYEDARDSGRGAALYERCARSPFEQVAVLDALDSLRELDIRDSSGGRTEGLIYQMRQDGDDRWLFVAHADEPMNKDLVAGETLRLRIRGEWACALYDTVAGTVTPIACEVRDGWTRLSYPMYDHDSLLFRLTAQAQGAPIAPPEAIYASRRAAAGKVIDSVGPDVRRFLAPVPVTLDEPNVLLLDLFEWSLNGADFEPVEEILRLDNAVRDALRLPSRSESVAQPWVESDETTPHTIRLRCTIHSELEISGAKLALERADVAQIRLNGEDVQMEPDGWYVDKCINTVALPEVRRGENVLEVSYRYGRKVDLEAMFLLGDFGVRLMGSRAMLTVPVRELAFGDITGQGLPFYGGNITYHMDIDGADERIEVGASCYRGALLKVSVDGGEAVPLVFAPYRATFDGLTKGRHRVDLKYFGNRINTFGQLHCNNRDKGYWWGPNSWRTVGEEWTYEYRLWRQGVLKSPEIML